MNAAIETSPSATPVTETFVRLDAVEVAKLLRKALNDAFPGAKFSVRKRKGSVSLDVCWTDGGPSKCRGPALLRRHLRWHD